MTPQGVFAFERNYLINMNQNIKQYFISAVIIAVAIIVVVVLLNGRVPATSSGGEAHASQALSASEKQYDFGSISMKNGLVEHTYAVTNTSAAPVTIKKVYTSCMCTTARITLDGKEYGPFGMPGHAAVPQVNQVLAAGATASIVAIFDPNAHGPAGVGPIQRSVIIEDADAGTLELTFSASVTP